MNSRWSALVTGFLSLLLIAALIGFAIGKLFPALFVATLGFLVWHLSRLYKLECWLRAGMDNPPPVTDDIWSDVYQRFCRLKQRSRKRKRKLGRIIAQFREASAALPEAVVILSDDNEVLWFNAAAHRLLGLHSSQDIGLPIAHLVRHPSFISFLSKKQYHETVQLPSPANDELLLSIRITPYGKKRCLLLATDITQAQRLEQMRRDFVANVSHELRTPLTVINGYLETFLDSGEACYEPWRQPLERMHQQSTRMLHLIEDLLVLSRLETETERRPEQPVAVPSLLASIVDDAIALSGERAHEITLEAEPNLWIRGHERELRSAFSNLVFNAVRHTPDRGRIGIRWFANDQHLYLEVEDNGEGIPPQHIHRLTERFYRVDRGRQRKRGGTGLGLAIVKHVLNRHDGQLQIKSRVGVGSTFICEFPLKRQLHKGPAAAINQ